MRIVQDSDLSSLLKKDRQRISDHYEDLLKSGKISSNDYAVRRGTNTRELQLAHLESLGHWDKALYIKQLKDLNGFVDDFGTLVGDVEFNLLFVGDIELEELDDEEEEEEGKEGPTY